MKLLMIKFSFYSIFFLIAFCAMISSCEKKGDPCDNYPSKTYKYYVKDEYKNKYSYTGTDTLVFVNDSGDIATLYGQGKNTRMDTYSDYSTPDPDCGNMDYWQFENIITEFSGNNTN